MKCPECVEAGEKSRVTPLGGMVTAMNWTPYYDEEGVYHSHDRNWRNMGYKCSNGHQWSTRTHSRCPAYGCEWNDSPNVA